MVAPTEKKLLAVEELLYFSEELRDKYGLTEEERESLFGLARNELQFKRAIESRKRRMNEQKAIRS